MKSFLNFLNKNPLKVFVVCAGFILLVGLGMGEAQQGGQVYAAPSSTDELTPKLLNTSALLVRAAAYDCAQPTGGQYLLGGGMLLACEGTYGQHYLYKIRVIDGHMFINFEGVKIPN